MQTNLHPQARLRSSLANAAWAVEERLVWGAGDTFRGVADAVRWPFERLAWALERALLWPLQERLGGWNRNTRLAAFTGLALAAGAAGVAGLLWAAPGHSGDTARSLRAASAAPVAPAPVAVPTGPTLHGPAPAFARAPAPAAGKVAGERAVASSPSTTAAAKANPGTAATASVAGLAGKPAGPAAIAVARQFSDAFVFYETGQSTAKVRTAFHRTASPRLARRLLSRPPRLPADAKVPQAKVLNVVSGPSLGGVYSISVSLLRVGVTSELRLEMERGRHGKWQVTDVLG